MKAEVEGACRERGGEVCARVRAGEVCASVPGTHTNPTERRLSQSYFFFFFHDSLAADRNTCPPGRPREGAAFPPEGMESIATCS